MLALTVIWYSRGKMEPADQMKPYVTVLGLATGLVFITAASLTNRWPKQFGISQVLAARLFLTPTWNNPLWKRPEMAQVLEVERAHIRRALDAARWAIEGVAGAARSLGLNPSTLRGRLRKLGIGKGG